MNKKTPAFSLFLLCLAFACVARAQDSLAPPHAPLVEGESVPVVPHSDIRPLLQSNDAGLAANKKLVFDMWRTVFNAGHVEAADRFFSPDYKEYSLVALNGLEGFKRYHENKVKRLDTVPQSITDPVVTLVAEKDFVAVVTVEHYYEPDDSGDTYTSSHFDLFRIENNLIVAHWDSAQVLKGVFPTPENEGGPLPVRGISGLDQYPVLQNEDPALENNKRLVFDLWRHTSEGGREEMALLYLDPIYIQHNPNASTGRAGFMEYFSMRPDTPIETHLEAPLIAMVAEGDLVVQALQGERPDPNVEGGINIITWFDMFRIKDGRLIEHWDTASKGEVPRIMEDTFSRE
jgi:predicted SnoaL-like aldol condensation-catalyzing enzyme